MRPKIAGPNPRSKTTVTNCVEEKLSSRIPNHVAVMMSGTSEWVRVRNVSECEGFHRGAEALANTVAAAQDHGVGYLTVYELQLDSASSLIKAPGTGTGIFRALLANNSDILKKQKVKLGILGTREGLPSDLRNLIECAQANSAKNSGLCLSVIIESAGRSDILRAVQKIAAEAEKKMIDPDTLSEGDFCDYLETSPLPDPDLLICTGGVTRPMATLTWETAYSEFVFLDTLWPDFRPSDFDAALAEFGRRQRRFGDIREAN